MADPNKRDKRLQDLLLKKKDRKPASEKEMLLQKEKAKKDAVIKMRDKGMVDIIKSLSKSAIAAEKSGDTERVKRLTKKIEKLKAQHSNEKKTSAFD